MEDDDNYVEHITEDVLTVLIGKRFFEALDEQMCPVDSATRRAQCTGSYALATTVLARLRFDSDDLADILRVLAAKGAHCDCEILFNVAETSRLKTEYWTGRAGELARARHT